MEKGPGLARPGPFAQTGSVNARRAAVKSPEPALFRREQLRGDKSA
jgi:hypothetical protein